MQDVCEGSRLYKFKDVTVEELKVIIGLLLHMDTTRTNCLQDY